MTEIFGVPIYQLFVFLHLLLFMLWLGADVGVNMLGRHFRKHDKYDVSQRMVLLQLLVNLDMIPRTAWALMVPVTVTMIDIGDFWSLTVWGVAFSWIIGGLWLWLVWYAHLHDQTPRAARARKIELFLKYCLSAFYLGLAIVSLVYGEPLAATWMALKALMFGLIFFAAILIDRFFKPVGPLLQKLIAEGSSREVEVLLLKTMNKSRTCVWVVYALVIGTAFLGNVKPL